MSTHCILSHWKRPENVARILDALQRQTVPFDKITIVDNSPDEDYRLSVKSTDVDVWRFPDNGYGPPCRFAPAIVNFRPKYTLFIDDDLLPGIRAHEHLLDTAHNLRDGFATLGEIGRNYYRLTNDGSYQYIIKDALRDHVKAVKVDLTCRAHFVLTDHIPAALIFRCKAMDAAWPYPGDDDWSRHDDILLCQGIQLYNESPYSYLTPKVEDKETWLQKEKLAEPNAMWHRRNHVETRTELVNIAADLGWRKGN